jgi:hypothetical protein
MFIHKVCEILAQAKVPYAIVGGYAVAMHGVLRGTVDVDLVISWSLEYLQKAEAAFKQIGLVSRIPVTAADLFRFRDEYMQKRNLVAWNFYDPANPVNQVDIIITYDLKGAHIKKLKTFSGVICILSIDELIKMKKVSGRPQDLEDIKALKEVSRSL